MSGPDYTETPPPDVPEEYEAVYAEAYRRALEEPEEPAPLPIRPPATPLDRVLDIVDEHRVAVLVAAAVLVAVVVTIIVTLGGGSAPTPSGAGAERNPANGPGGMPPVATQPTGTDRTRSVEVLSARATCTAPDAVDGAGHLVSYRARNTIDGDLSTAWRCGGTALGVRLTFRLPPGTTVRQVGLVPGYAKTDPADGVDRYAEGNRITLVRWVLAPGVSILQRLDPDPLDRSLQVLRVPATRTDVIRLQILTVARGSRNATAISTVRFRS